jgi:aminoglycoside phosphotransferase (APT) family kinase protein
MTDALGTATTTARRAEVDFAPDAPAAYLARRFPDLAPALAAGDLAVARISGGQSNPTYRLRIGARELILRKAPSGPALPAAHAVDREHRVMAALAGTGVPVPAMVAVEDDPSVLGARFYLMEVLDGEVVHDSRLPGRAPEARGAVYADKARILARLHRLDPAERGLGDFGRTGPFFTRQILRWTRQWELSKTREIPEIDALAGWLTANDPQEAVTAIVHGDYRIGNLMLHRTEPRIVGVLDWELATLGHPLADLAHTVAMWHVSPDEYGGLLGCDLAALGIPGRARFEEDYLREAGSGAGLSVFHHAFALFRFAVIFEGIAARAIRGSAASDNASEVGALSVVLARRAAAMVAGEFPLD